MLKQTIRGSLENNSEIHSFGQSIFIDDGVMLIGADDASVNGYPDGGVVYVFNKSDDTYTETNIIQGSNTTADAFYGWDISKSNNTIIVGADDENTYGYCAGAVYVYIDEKQTDILTGSREQNSYFGYSIDIQDDVIVVGEPAYRSDFIQSRHKLSPLHGRVFVFERTGIVWNTKYIIDPITKNPYGFFGGQVKIWKDYIVVSEQGTGRVYLYKQGILYKQLTPDNNTISYGKSLYCGEDFLIIGSLGQVDIWKYSHDDIVKIQTIERGGQFGYSLDYYGGTLVISDVETYGLEYDNIEQTNDNNGRVYVYKMLDDVFIENDVIVGLNENVGHRIKIYDNNIFICSPHDNKGKGVVWIYEIK